MDNHQILAIYCLLVSLNCCLAAEDFPWKLCHLMSLNADGPKISMEHEAGISYYWDYKYQQYQCAGVAPWRMIIQPKGLSTPLYANGHALVYVVQGNGTIGVVNIPGCPEASDSSHTNNNIHNTQEGDIVAIPAGAVYWFYNHGLKDLVLIFVAHTHDPMKYVLAGNLKVTNIGIDQYHDGGERQSEHLGNVFREFDTQFLSQVFQVDQEIARKVKGNEDKRGHVVRVEGDLQLIRKPRSTGQERQQRESGSPWSIIKDNAGLNEETICRMQLVHNIGTDPSQADEFITRAGWIKTLNSKNMPILKHLQLSAKKGVLYRNAIDAPHSTQNAHSILYAVRGEAHVQIMDQRGKAVFNDTFPEGKFIVVPQYFVITKQASNQGFEWITFYRNDVPFVQPLAGRTSAIHAIPVDVLANVYQISREEAIHLQMNRQEASTLLEPSQSFEGAAASM